MGERRLDTTSFQNSLQNSLLTKGNENTLLKTDISESSVHPAESVFGTTTSDQTSTIVNSNKSSQDSKSTQTLQQPNPNHTHDALHDLQGLILCPSFSDSIMPVLIEPHVCDDVICLQCIHQKTISSASDEQPQKIAHSPAAARLEKYSPMERYLNEGAEKCCFIFVVQSHGVEVSPHMTNDCPKEDEAKVEDGVWRYS